MAVGSPTSQSVVPAGMPCWVELAAADEPAVRAFYEGLFGWDCHVKRDPATATRRYTIASLGGYQVAGLYQAARNQPTGWTVHLAVANTASTAEWVEHLGGSVTLGPVDIPDRGSILHARDASGAPVAFWQPTETWSFGAGLPGTFSGADLNTHDGPTADNFYCRLFNLTSEQIGTDTIDYAEWRLDHQPVIYRYQMDEELRRSMPPHWMTYFGVDPARGADAVAGHALMLGGSVVTPPFDTPFGRTAVITDPDGSVFSIIDHEQAVDNGAGRAEVDDPHGD
ncbi:VOC family protein [Qaidamihabitans albus]|uniref:VOC family protein n=1 Tax=Qaidamihabitans albus TaxID=2795733 RepID=UPI0018F16A8D|nr:VOC family protein [Qaidamihabitans albus]